MSLLERLHRLFPDLRKVPLPAYVVGGAIRDLLLERDPADVDVASNEPLAAASALHHKVIRLGKEEHISAYRVVLGEHVYDFAELLDHDIDADLARRDFTINAMALDLETGKLLDPHSGRRDLDARVVRMVDASNFDDDPLRMLKSIRMAVTYDFTIDEATIAAIAPRASRIGEVAAERVSFELLRIFSANRFSISVELLRRTGLEIALGLTSSAGRDDLTLEMSFALLVRDPRAFGERWRWSESLIRDVTTLQNLMRDHDRIALYDAGERLARMLPIAGLDMPDFTIKPLLTGDEIASLRNIEPGRELGAIKRALLEAQIRGEVRTKEEAERFVTK